MKVKTEPLLTHLEVVSKQLLKIGGGMNATQMAHPLSGELRTFKKDMFDCQMCIAASTERSVVASQEIPVGSVGMAYTQPEAYPRGDPRDPRIPPGASRAPRIWAPSDR